MTTNWHVATAAEAITAAQFARFGYDVSVQYGANQPEYDLMISSPDGRMLKISVKGSADGGWGLTQGMIREADYHGAADKWLARHKPGTALCLVQFKGVEDDNMPRIYLASPKEIADHLKAARGGHGETALKESKTYGPKGIGAGAVDQIPKDWVMTRERAAQILTELGR